MPCSAMRRCQPDTERWEDLSGAGFSKGAERGTSREGWQDGAPPAYWAIVQYFSGPEGSEVLPERRVSMDGGSHQAPAALKQPPSHRVSVMEGREGACAVGCADRSESLLSRRAGAQAQHGAPTITGVVLGSASEPWEAAPRVSRGNLLCAVVGGGLELVGGTSISPSPCCDDVRATLCGASGEGRVSGLCHSGSRDGVTGDRETCVAGRVATQATPGADGRAAPGLCACLGGSWLVGAGVSSAQRAVGRASAAAEQYRRDVSTRQECPLSLSAGVGAAGRDARGGRGDGVSGGAPPPQLHAAGARG